MPSCAQAGSISYEVSGPRETLRFALASCRVVTTRPTTTYSLIATRCLYVYQLEEGGQKPLRRARYDPSSLHSTLSLCTVSSS